MAGKEGGPTLDSQQQPTNIQPERPATVDKNKARLDMAAVLNAYDLSSPEEQARMLREMKEKGDTSVSGEPLQRGRVAAKMSINNGISREAGLRDLKTLEEASKQIPGIKVLLRILAQDPPKGDPSKK
jgi:hypothetical protein